MRSSLVVFQGSLTLAMLGSCAEAPTTPAAPGTLASVTAVGLHLDELVLPSGEEESAPWLEVPVKSPAALRTLTFDREVVSLGQHAAIIETKLGHFAIHDVAGVLGPLKLPDDALFVRLDGKDRVYAATKAGRLFVAATVKAAAASGGLSEMTAVPGAVDWDAGNGLAAASFNGISVAPDGTLLLHCGFDACPDRVRAPHALGDPGAWRAVDVANASRLRPWLGGAVLAFVADKDDSFSVILDRAGKPPDVLGQGVSLAGVGRLRSISLEGAHVTLTTSDADVERQFVLSKGGALVAR